MPHLPLGAVPYSLGGYQNIHHTIVLPDDIAIPPYSMSNGDWMWAHYANCVGLKTDGNGMCGSYRIYRLLAVPKQSDGKETLHEQTIRHQLVEAFKAAGVETTDSPPHLDLRKIQEKPKPKAKTYDEGKDPLAYLPWAGVRAVSQVQAYGHKKYEDYNNYRKGMEEGRNLSCALRHIAAYMEGESLDPESKQSHLAHAACRLLFVLQNQHDKVAIDDRYKK